MKPLMPASPDDLFAYLYWHVIAQHNFAQMNVLAIGAVVDRDSCDFLVGDVTVWEVGHRDDHADTAFIGLDL